MIRKLDIKSFMRRLKEDEVLVIRYEGFTGKGINGLDDKSINIKNINEDKDLNIVKTYTNYQDDKVRISITDFMLEENYILASFASHRKGQYNAYFIKEEDYSIIVPYDKITSFEIRKIKINN